MVRTHEDRVFKLILSTFLLVGSYYNDSRQRSVPSDRIHIIYSLCVVKGRQVSGRWALLLFGIVKRGGTGKMNTFTYLNSCRGIVFVLS